MAAKNVKEKHSEIKKVSTGISGFDDITFGGLPFGRPTLVCGNAGCGKTVFSMEFLINGARLYDEPGVFISFEENPDELQTNLASYGLDELLRKKKIVIDYIRIERNEIQETGEYDLEGLFIRLEYAINSIGAKRIVLDTIESLFSGFSNDALLRAELRRLFNWLKTKKLTAIITGERGDKMYTRHGLEEYVADCVIVLDHELNNKIATRRLKIVKYRGSAHGTNEYPFLITSNGVSVLPITTLTLDYPVSRERISTGIPSLDMMFDGKGFFRGSSILLSGSPGSGKTSIASFFIDAACRRGEKSIFFSFEESPSQIIRNMKSIGLDFEKWVKKGLLHIDVARPSVQGIEMHIVSIYKKTNELKPKCVVFDPISDFSGIGTPSEIKSMLIRTVDFFKMNSITALFTDLTSEKTDSFHETGISSLADTWITITNESGKVIRERNLSIVKSRGMSHSEKTVNFIFTDKGIDFK